MYIENVTEYYIDKEQQVYVIMDKTNKNRNTGSTNMNIKSSRSHLIFKMSVC